MAIDSILSNLHASLLEDENFETTTLIWLDSKSIRSEERRNSQKKFRSAINHTKIFDNIQECKKYINNLSKDDRAVFITSGKLGKDFVPCIHQFRQIRSIYIFCMDEKKNERWTKEYIKVSILQELRTCFISNFRSKVYFQVQMN
jgi:hypothetical protein